MPPGEPLEPWGDLIQWCRTLVLDQPGAKLALMSAEIPNTHLALTTDLGPRQSEPLPDRWWVCALSQESRLSAPSTPGPHPTLALEPPVAP